MDDQSRPPIAPPVAGESRPPVAEQSRPLASVSDDDLLRRLADILAQSRRVEKDLVAHIAEADARRLYAREAFPSMFAYCKEALHLSEAEAYLRIAAARASREHPVILTMLGDGRLHLSGIALLAPHLTAENRQTLLRRATHRSKRQIEELIAEVAPREDVPAWMRRLPERPAPPAATPPTPPGMGNPVTQRPPQTDGGPHDPAPIWISPDSAPVSTLPEPARSSLPPEPAPPVPRPVVRPLAPGRYKVQFTASAALHDKLERLQPLLRSQVPDGDLGAIIEAAVTEKLERLEARRFAATSRPRKTLSKTDTSPASRHVPAAVRREVRERDGDRCVYVDASGRRCSERHRLEYHHRLPFGMGGDHRPEGMGFVCKAHNRYLAEHDYGREAMARFKQAGKAVGKVAGVASGGNTAVP